ncbi:hypothetical protein BH708_01490 [Brachybacterium sp. P6-10-X1]|nr:hypothetical protein BH708_01490 [Brachybacterium sp. P6-10-X1]
MPIGAGLQRWEENPSVAAMVRDDLLARVLPGIFLPPDLLRTAVERALALGCALGGQLQSYHVIAGPSAAWVFLGGPPPSPAELLSSAHRGSIIGATVRTARLHPHEVETIGGAPVTSPLRTAVDLLRFCPDHVTVPALRGLLGGGHLTERTIWRQLQAMGRRPGARAARGRWEALLGGVDRAA